MRGPVCKPVFIFIVSVLILLFVQMIEITLQARLHSGTPLLDNFHLLFQQYQYFVVGFFLCLEQRRGMRPLARFQLCDSVFQFGFFSIIWELI